MAYPLSVHAALDQDAWNLETIEVVLRLYPSTVNERIFSTLDFEEMAAQTPLHRVLMDRRCSLAIVKLLLRYGADPNLKIEFTKSSLLLCLLHQRRERVEIIRALVEAGAKVSELENGCLSYAITENMELEIVDFLLVAGADLYKTDITRQSPLAHAVKYFDIGSFKILCDRQKVDINVARNRVGGSLLHTAVETEGCTPDFVTFLIDRGVRINSVDAYNYTPLHVAVRKWTCRPDVIDVLLRRGSLVDVQAESGRTPLDIAVMRYENPDVHLSLLRYCFLQNPEYSCDWINRLNAQFAGHANDHLCRLNIHLSYCADGCWSEIQRMESENVGDDRTLLEFLRTYSGNQMGRIRENGFDIDKLLMIISNKLYPAYSDVIVTKFRRSLLLDKLEECNIRALVEKRSGMRWVARKVLLNQDCARRLAEELDDADLLSFIMAFM